MKRNDFLYRSDTLMCIVEIKMVKSIILFNCSMCVFLSRWMWGEPTGRCRIWSTSRCFPASPCLSLAWPSWNSTVTAAGCLYTSFPQQACSRCGSYAVKQFFISSTRKMSCSFLCPTPCKDSCCSLRYKPRNDWSSIKIIVNAQLKLRTF